MSGTMTPDEARHFEYRVFLLHLSDDVTGEMLERLKFPLKRQLGAGVLEKCTNGMRLFDVMEQRMLISEEDVSFLSYLLRCVKCERLADKLVDSFQKWQRN
jgi:hypothetical protein